MMNALTLLAAKIDPSKVGIPTSTADSVVTSVLDLVYFFAGVVAVIVIIIAGIMYTTSGGDIGSEGKPAAVKQAKNAILYAVIGLIVIMMAFVITGFIVGRF